MSTSTLLGIRSHFSWHFCPRGKLNAQSPNSGCLCAEDDNPSPHLTVLSSVPPSHDPVMSYTAPNSSHTCLTLYHTHLPRRAPNGDAIYGCPRVLQVGHSRGGLNGLPKSGAVKLVRVTKAMPQGVIVSKVKGEIMVTSDDYLQIEQDELSQVCEA